MNNIIFNFNTVGINKKELCFQGPTGQLSKFEKISFLNDNDQELEDFLDRSSLRTMNRTTKILIALCEKYDVNTKLSMYTPERIGLYCAIYGGVFPYKVFDHFPSDPERYLKDCINNLRPQDMLKRSNGVSAAQLGKHLGIKGPVVAFINKNYASLHAIEQACFDLEYNKIDCAVIASALSIEDDPYNEIELKKIIDNDERSECAAIFGLEGKNHKSLLLRSRQLFGKNRKYGISQLIVDISNDLNDQKGVL